MQHLCVCVCVWGGGGGGGGGGGLSPVDSNHEDHGDNVN